MERGGSYNKALGLRTLSRPCEVTFFVLLDDVVVFSCFMFWRGAFWTPPPGPEGIISQGKLEMFSLYLFYCNFLNPFLE